MGVQKSAEAIVGWSPSTEGLNMRSRLEANSSMMVGVAERSAEMWTLIHKEREQNSQQLGAEAECTLESQPGSDKTPEGDLKAVLRR